MPMGDFLAACVDVTGGDASLEWVPADFLAEQGLQSWQHIQMWADQDSPLAGSLTWSPDKALAAGLSITPVATTIRDTLAWFHGLPAERQAELRSGIPEDVERRVLDAWTKQAAG